MNFPGSNFFSDSKFLEKKNFIGNTYGLPLLISNRLFITQPNSKYRRDLRMHMKHYRKYYKIKGYTIDDKSCPPTRNCGCMQPSTRMAPRFSDLKEVSLPPNRYELKRYDLAQMIQKQTGTKGPYACFTGERNNSTMIGHKAPSKFKGSKTMFYNIPGGIDLLLQSRNYFIMKIRQGDRVTAQVLNADLPGPDAYYPQNFCIKKVPKSKLKTKEPFVFFPASCVPQSERFIRTQPFGPGPGRYNVEELACPCRRYELYDPEKLYAAELLHMNGKKQKKMTNKLRLCLAPKMRNIFGHGHTWLFNSRTLRLIKKSTKEWKIRGNMQFQMDHDAQYIRIINYPKRIKLSFPLMKIGFETGKLRFNTVERPMMRSKLRTNKHVAFNSSCPRFKDLKQMSKSDFSKHRSKHMMVVEPIPTTAKKDEHLKPLQRLMKLPSRLELLRVHLEACDKVQTFQPLPQAKILVEELGTIFNESLERVNGKLKNVDYFKDEFLVVDEAEDE